VTRGVPGLCLLAGLFGCLIGCAPSIRDPFGQALRRGRVPSSAPPESLTIDLGISPLQKGATPFSARLYARPYRQYRLDAFGWVSTAASYFWADGRLTLLLPEKREAWQGSGDRLEVEGLPLRLPGMQTLLGFLWSQPLPGFSGRDADSLSWSGDTLRWAVRGEPWQALFDDRGLCLEVRSPALLIRYRKHRRFGTRVIPGEAEVFADGEPLVAIKVDRIDEHPAWKKDPFELRIPKGYALRQTEFPNGGN
jgi:hypothetical protein